MKVRQKWSLLTLNSKDYESFLMANLNIFRNKLLNRTPFSDKRKKLNFK